MRRPFALYDMQSVSAALTTKPHHSRLQSTDTHSHLYPETTPYPYSDTQAAGSSLYTNTIRK